MHLVVSCLFQFEKDNATSTILLPDVERGVVTVEENPQVDVNVTDIPTPTRKSKTKSRKSVMMRVLIQACSMTFLAEWGDRSQLTTIVLAARDNVYGVIVGGVLGHALCTGLAVIGGRMIAQRISVRTGKFSQYHTILQKEQQQQQNSIHDFYSLFLGFFSFSDHCWWDCIHLFCI